MNASGATVGSARGAIKALALGWVFCVFLAGPAAGTAAAKATEGKPFPHFSGTAIGGGAVDTSQFAGKVFIIEFWSIYCSSCIQEMPHVIDLYNKYHEAGLEAVSVNLDVLQAKRVPKFMKRNFDFVVPYPTVIDDKRRTIANQLGVGILPTTIIVDTTGTVQMFHVGYKPGFEKELEEKIKKLLPGQ